MSEPIKKPRAATFIVSSIGGSGQNNYVTTGLVTDDYIPFFLADDSTNKSAVSLDQMFLPIASRSGYSSQEEHKLPFLGGTTVYSGLTILNSLDRSVLDTVVTAGGLALGHAPSVGSGQTLLTEDVIGMTQYSGDIRRVVGMRLPMFAVGTGLSVSGGVVGDSNRSDSPGDDKRENFSAMKAGPVDLRWDERKQSWVGSDFFSSDIVYGYLSSNITAPSGRYQSTTFTITSQYYTSSGTWDTGPERTCLNKDPNFSIGGYALELDASGNYVPNMDIWVGATRLQSPTFSNGTVYMPFYIGCE